MRPLMKIDHESSSQIWVLKALAVMSIFFAHMPLNHNYPTWLVLLYQMFGLIGVPTFFILSGFLFKKNGSSWGHKVKRLFIPVILWGTVTYIMHCIPADTNFALSAWAGWVLGSNTYLYFVWVLFFIMILYSLYDNPWVWICIGIVSILLTQTRLISYTSFWTPYMNPFNFIAYFSAGVLLRRREWWNLRSSNVWMLCVMVIVVLTYLVAVKFDLEWYFNLHTFIVRLFGALFLISLVSKLKVSSPKLVYVGKVSFVIYLVHMPVASTINKIMSIMPPYAEFIKLLMAFSISLFAVWLMDYISKRVLKNFNVRSLIGFHD